MNRTILSILCLLFAATAAAQNLTADSLLAAYNYADALSLYKDMNLGAMNSTTAMNASIAAAQCDDDSLALTFVSRALKADPAFFDERISVTELLQDCRLLSAWDELQNENERRLECAMSSYDIPLRRRLLEIYHSDQNIRGRLIMASKEVPVDQHKLSTLYRQMNVNDSINYIKTIEILDTYAWVPRSKVGTANQALFFVIQHARPEVINRYISIFETAASDGEIPKDLFAKMYDRQLLYAGKPQKYGTQKVRKDAGTREMVLWKIEDPANVNSLRKKMGLPPLEGFPQ